jgi:hypothetical protein
MSVAGIFLLAVLLVTVVLLIYAYTNEKGVTECEHDETEEDKPEDLRFLFQLFTKDDADVSVSHSLNEEKTFTVHLPTDSYLTVFSDIPYHMAWKAGDMNAANLWFNSNKHNPLINTTNMTPQQKALSESFFMGESPFIDLLPNCSFNLTRRLDDGSNRHHSLIAAMRSFKVEGESTVIEFHIEDEMIGMVLPEEGQYEHVSITVDDFLGDLFGDVAFDDIIAIATAGLAVVGAGLACAGSLGIGCAAAAVGAGIAIAQTTEHFHSSSKIDFSEKVLVYQRMERVLAARNRKK